jgi:hypothetical protein
MATRHLQHPHVPHPSVPHAHLDERPWRAFPIAMVTIVLFATVFIILCFAIAKAVTGHAY